jgi:hypothetical protein
MFRLRALVVAVAVVLTAPTAAHAQQHAAAVTSNAGPRVALTATAAHNVVVAAPAPMAQRKNLGQPIALMVVGGAAVLLGAIVGNDAGTIIMIGGTIAFLIGLYQYVQ